MNEAANSTSESKVKGWLKQQLAEYYHFVNPTESQVILRSAVGENPRVTRPLGGIDYRRLSPSSISQANQCAAFLKSAYHDGNRLIVEVNSYLAQLAFQPDTADAFEEVVKDVGTFLGFSAQRPEKEFGRGPDVLWEVGERTYFIIECKNGVASKQPINKHDCNQLNGSTVWFHEKYDATCSVVPIIIHPVGEYEYAASLDADTRVITEAKLDELRDAIRQFAVAAASGDRGDASKVGGMLQHSGLTKGNFVKFLIAPTRTRKK
jgi:hypothetical protein